MARERLPATVLNAHQESPSALGAAAATDTAWAAVMPRLANAMLPKLYDDSSRVRNALWSIGSTLPTKTAVETIPASIGSVTSMTRR